MKKLGICLILWVLVNAVQAQEVEKIVKKYFKVYETRNFEALQQFYDEEAVFEDIIFGEYRKGVEDIFKFLNQGIEIHLFNIEDKSFWHIQNMIVQDNKVVVEGWHAPFYMNDNKEKVYGPWRFTTFLYFKDGKIVKHIDFFNYPNELLKYRKYQNNIEKK